MVHHNSNYTINFYDEPVKVTLYNIEIDEFATHSFTVSYVGERSTVFDVEHYIHKGKPFTVYI
jgi:hypothetical protein